MSVLDLLLVSVQKGNHRSTGPDDSTEKETSGNTECYGDRARDFPRLHNRTVANSSFLCDASAALFQMHATNTEEKINLSLYARSSRRK
jgi:hypothetical protein